MTCERCGGLMVSERIFESWDEQRSLRRRVSVSAVLRRRRCDDS